MGNFKINFIANYNEQIWEEFKKLSQLIESHELVSYRFNNANEYLYPTLAIRGSKVDSKTFERLEYFGDIILKVIVNKYLFNEYPDFNQADLTEYSSILTSNKTLAKVFDILNLEKLGIILNIGTLSVKQKADFIEALIAAIFLDSSEDYPTIKKIISKFLVFEKLMGEIKLNPWRSKNPKSYLNEYVQKLSKGLGKIFYETKNSGVQNAPQYKSIAKYSSSGDKTRIDVEIEGEIKTKIKEAELSASEKMIFLLQEREKNGKEETN